MSRSTRSAPGPVLTDRVTGAGEHRVTCHLDVLLAARGLTLTELAQRAGVTVVNLSVLKNDRARAIRFSILTAICDALGCQPGELLSVIRSTP